jgi:uncharacterized protein
LKDLKSRMYFFVQIQNKIEALSERAKYVDAHRAYLTATSKKILAGGALLGDDQQTLIGSNYVIEVASRQEADEWVKNDPFTLAGLRERIELTPWVMAVFNREFVLGKSVAEPPFPGEAEKS